MHSVDTPTTKLYLRDDGVLVALGINPEIPRTTETVDLVMDALAEVAGEERRPVLWDVRNLSAGSLDSVGVFVARVEESVAALGLLIDDGAGAELLTRIEAFSPIVDALLVPVQLFREEAEAVAWLQEFVGPD